MKNTTLAAILTLLTLIAPFDTDAQVRSGTFSTFSTEAWTVVFPPENTSTPGSGVRMADIDGPGERLESPAFFARTGSGAAVYLQQQISLSAGTTYHLAADLAMFSSGFNADGGTVTALIGGTVVASHAFEEVSANVPEYAQLAGSYAPPSNGVYTLSIQFTRTFGVSASTPENYIDNIRFSGTGQPAIAFSPESRTNNAGTTARFAVTAVGSEPLFYRWKRNGIELSDGARVSGAQTATLNIANVANGDAGSYTVVVSNSVGVAASDAALLTVEPALHPSAYAGLQNGDFSFSTNGWDVVLPAGNTSTPAFGVAMINIDGDGPFAASPAFRANVGNNALLNLEQNVFLSAGSEYQLAADLAMVSPGNNGDGGTVRAFIEGEMIGSFSFGTTSAGVNEYGTLSGTYVPQFSGNHRLSIRFSRTGGAGGFSSTPTDYIDNITLTCVPVIIDQPISQTNEPGTTAIFSVSATGGAELFYQWHRNGVAMADETGTDLTIHDVQLSHAATYTVVVSNALGVAVSVPAQLVIVVPEPVGVTAGVYHGLFYEEGAISHESAGFFSLRVSTRNGFAAKFSLDENVCSVSGRLSTNGATVTNVSRAKLGKEDLLLSFTVDAQQVTGTLSSATWTALMVGDKAVFNATNPAMGYLGAYTLLLPGASDAASAPPGFSFATLVVSSNGTVKASGLTADGQPVKHQAPLSQNGEWPFYSGLYRTPRAYTNLLTLEVRTNRNYTVGSALGWITFTNQAPQGQVSWIKTPVPSSTYPDGFGHVAAIVGSSYVRPQSASCVLCITNGTLTLSDGNLSAPIVRTATVLSNNVVTITPLDHALRMSIAPRTGMLRGGFRHPENSNTVTKISGAVLQNQGFAGGFFVGTNLTGSVLLEP